MRLAIFSGDRQTIVHQKDAALAFFFYPTLKSRIARLNQLKNIPLWMASLIGISITLLAGFLLFGPSGRDDVYMTLWPALQFSEHGHIVNYNGEALEQSSSLLHVVVLGSLHRVLGGNIVDLNFVFVLILGLASGWLSLILGKKLGLPLLPLALALSGNACFTYWSMGGLDAVIAAFCWLLFALAYLQTENKRKWPAIGFAFVLLLLVRPENGFVLALLFVLLALIKFVEKNGKEHRLQAAGFDLLLLGIVVAMGVTLGMIRHSITGNWFPQPVTAKASAPDFARFWMGIKYVYHQTRLHPEFFVVWAGFAWLLIQQIRGRIKDQSLHVFAAIAVAGIAFAVFVGGDWMENARFLVPYLPILILLTLSSFQSFPTKIRTGLGVGLIMLSAWGMLQTARFQGTGYGFLTKPAIPKTYAAADFAFAERNNRDHLRDIPPLKVLQQATKHIFKAKGQKVTILSHQAGFIPFHLAQSNPDEFRFIDLMGLCTSDFTDCHLTHARGQLNGGLNMDLIYLFDDFERLQASCGFERPDIIFDLDQQNLLLSEDLKANGYTIYDLQKGIMPMGKSGFPGLEIDATEFVAVDLKWRYTSRQRNL